MKQNSFFSCTKKAFTLVELIVVVTILAILATIGFVSYSWYISWVRDVNRIASLTSIADGMELYRTTNDLPTPDKYINIFADTKQIATQWYAGKSVLQTISYTKNGKDPKDDTYFSYYLTEDKKYYQLVAFLENQENLESASISNINQTFANDYSQRYPKVYGNKLGILLSQDNTPIQEVQEVKDEWKIDVENVGTQTYTSYLDDNLYASWEDVNYEKLSELSKSWGKFWTVEDNQIVFRDPNDSSYSFLEKFSGSSNIINYIQKDSEQNIIVVGTFWNDFSIDGIDLESAGRTDIFIAKYNAFWKLKWLKSIGWDNSDVINWAQVDTNGNLFITGYYEDNISIGNINLSYPWNFNGYIAKINTQWNTVWAKNIGTAGKVFGQNLKVLPSGDVLVWVKAHGRNSSDIPVVNGINLSNKWILLIKYKSDGSVLWTKTFTSDNTYTSFTTTRIDENNNIYLAGGFNGNLSFQSNQLNSQGNSDVFLIKLSEDWDYIWKKNFWGSHFDRASNMKIFDGNIYMIGIYKSSTFWDNGHTITNPDNLHETAFISKHNLEGDTQWIKKIHGSKVDELFDLEKNNKWNIIVVWETTSQSITSDSLTATSAWWYDAIRAEFTPAGSIESLDLIGSTDTDQIRTIYTDGNKIYIWWSFGKDVSVESKSFTDEWYYGFLLEY